MDKDKLLKRKQQIHELELEIDGQLQKFGYRALTRAEALELRKSSELDESSAEREALSRALVDPELTVDEVREWQECSPAGEIQPLLLAIFEVSGMGEGAAKSAYKSTGK